MPRRVRRRDDDIAQVIVGLILIGLFITYNAIKRIPSEWAMFLFYAIPAAGFVAVVTVGLIAWYSRKPDSGRDGSEVIRREQDKYRTLPAEQLREEQERREQEKATQFHRASKVKAIKSLAPLALERYVAELFQRMGYQSSLTPGQGDHGIDVKLINPRGEREIIQCKQWPNWNDGLVGEPQIRDFYGAMMSENAVCGYFVAPHGFTPQARSWAMGKPMILADANWLYLKAGELNLNLDEGELSSLEGPSADAAAPLCPKHGVPMVKKIAKRGGFAGEPFYGCPLFPDCMERIHIP
ncbi:MAG: restriction endonuclease [Chloroflexi bacterium]|nr:restriction endonuclease [Chloroflexota bacterium]